MIINLINHKINIIVTKYMCQGSISILGSVNLFKTFFYLLKFHVIEINHVAGRGIISAQFQNLNDANNAN